MIGHTWPISLGPGCELWAAGSGLLRATPLGTKAKGLGFLAGAGRLTTGFGKMMSTELIGQRVHEVLSQISVMTATVAIILARQGRSARV